MELIMNLKNMTYKEITQMVSSLNTSGDIDEALHKLDDLIESMKILRSMLEGRKALQMQKDQQKRRKGLKVVKTKKQDS
jgi:hypothetical protein